MNARATSFAGYSDLVGYIDCLLAGGSETHCYNDGDNGRGCWGDVTAQIHTPMVALPESAMIAKWGSKSAARGKLVTVKLFLDTGHVTFQAELRDQGPDGVVDLNPAALLAAGLPQDKELSVPAEWEWVD